MKKYTLTFLTALALASLMGCGDSQQHSHKNKSIDTISNHTLARKTDMSTQKITPCLWVDKDAKAVVDYYLSIFKNGKMKDYRQYKNPPQGKEQGGQDTFETAVMEIGDIELSILAAGPYEVLPKGWTVKVVKESGLCSN
jgi:predicted small lipoprotein YifL